MDIVGPLCECQGMKYIVTSVCYFTEWVEARAVPDETGAQVAGFIYWLFTRYGCLEVCISDQSECGSRLNKGQTGKLNVKV